MCKRYAQERRKKIQMCKHVPEQKFMSQSQPGGLYHCRLYQGLTTGTQVHQALLSWR